MKSKEIFQTLERQAIEWGKQHNRFHVGDVVETQLSWRKTKCRVRISSIDVVIGRNAQTTILKTLTLLYIGRRLKKDGSLLDVPGGGVCLESFTRDDGETFEGNFNGVNETVNDGGFWFNLEGEQEAKELYPDAYEGYLTEEYPYEY